MYNKISQKKKFSVLTNSVASACIIAGSVLPATSLICSSVSATTADDCSSPDTLCSASPSDWMDTFLSDISCNKLAIELDIEESQSTNDSASSSDSSSSTPMALEDYSDAFYNNLPKATPARNKRQEPCISYLKPCAISAYALDVNNNPTAHGTISCNESLVKVAPKFNIPYAGDATFNITSEPGYELVNVIVDGEKIGPVNSYTFNTITDDHSIAANFRSSEDYSMCDLYE
jgi:hypothetical protein